MDTQLGTMPTDGVFVGSVLVKKIFVPTIFVKLSANTARAIGVVENQHFSPYYKFLTVEDRDGNIVSMCSMWRDGYQPAHFPFDPTSPEALEFLRLGSQGQVLGTDITVVGKKNHRYGTFEVEEITGDHLEWFTRNQLRGADKAGTNDWSEAYLAYKASQGIFNRDKFLTFRRPIDLAVHAAASTNFFTRGEEDYQPDFSTILSPQQDYDLAWAKENL
ncbi:MAG: hypothetical protein AAFZ52_19925, partial [Bacteroidota bacterium]